jgi:hypothetical protein
MFCQGCGFGNDEGVNYCKRCGANLQPTPAAKPANPFIIGCFLLTILFITLAGLMLPMVAMSELHGKVNEGMLNGFSLLILLVVFSTNAMLIWLLTRLLGVGIWKKPKDTGSEPRPRYVTNGQQYDALPSPPISMTSVTEHTTRNFDAVPVRQRQTGETN